MRRPRQAQRPSVRRRRRRGWFFFSPDRLLFHRILLAASLLAGSLLARSLLAGSSRLVGASLVDCGSAAGLPSPASTRRFLPSFLKSVSYQPLPFRRNCGAETSRCSLRRRTRGTSAAHPRSAFAAHRSHGRRLCIDTRKLASDRFLKNLSARALPEPGHFPQCPSMS